MRNPFVAVDVETANADMASICQLGVVTFENGTVVDSWGTLVNPQDYFDGVNVAIHGIDEHDVQSAPTFTDVATRLRHTFAGSVVASHMPFDRVAIAKACDKYDLSNIECTWLDTARVVRRAWPRFSRRGYGLANIASWLGIEFKHHDAEEDARAAGLVLMRAVTESGLGVDEWVVRASEPICGDPSSSTGKRTGNPDGPLTDEVVVFTGSLSILRREAADLAANAGCDVATTVGKTVTLLVVGDQDVRKLEMREKSSKHRKAERMIQEGHSIRIMTESDFRSLVRH